MSPKEVGMIGGSYNFFLQTALPDDLRVYNPADETADSSHLAFTTTFPRGFAVEVIEVYAGPPVIVLKFRHWGYMEGPFKGHAPTGEMVEFFGIGVYEVDNSTSFPFPSFIIGTVHLQYSVVHRRRTCLCAVQVDENMKIVRIEFFFDRGELLGGLVRGPAVESAPAREEEEAALPAASTSCPFLRNTG